MLALVAKWRLRARTYMQEAHESGNVRDIHRFAGMASSLEFAVRDLCWTGDLGALLVRLAKENSSSSDLAGNSVTDGIT